MKSNRYWGTLVSLLKQLPSIWKPQVSLEQARKIAQEACEREGMHWGGGIMEEENLLWWHFRVGTKWSRTSTLVICVNKHTGRISRMSTEGGRII